MERHTLASIVFASIAAFLGILLALAVFVTHPPTLGWIGLGVVAVLAVLVGAVVVAFFPRSRVSARRMHPHADGLYRLLVVADADVEPNELSSAVKLRLIGRQTEVLVVAPVLTPSPLHFLTDDEAIEHDQADERLGTVLRRLADAGVRAQGVLGTDDPLQAAGDALVDFDADEILLVAPVAMARSWQERDFEKQARDIFGVPVSTVYGSATVKAV
jgi:hypothetical protein